MKSTLLFFACTFPWMLVAQGGYTSWFSGDTADVGTSHLPGLVLAGGGGDNDEAMTWMLERAAEGDVLVLRASGADGYNEYFFSDLGANVNSVETIRFDDVSAASDPYVLRRIREAEVLFLAGGDQYDYYTFWKDNEVEEAINYLLLDKQITVGGASAGMAVLGHAYYTPETSGVTSAEALSDPFHPFMDTVGFGDFLLPPFMDFTITDTHFDQRTRDGRLLTFLARLTQNYQTRFYGIAANEYCAVCIDENGLARVFGEYPAYEEDRVYFLQVNCEDDYFPEFCEPLTPLTWYQNGEAVQVYNLPAAYEGVNTFDLTNWQDGQGGDWEYWYAENGLLERLPGQTFSPCGFSSISESGLASFSIFPNPTSGVINLITSEFSLDLQVIDRTGKIIYSAQWLSGTSLDLGFLPEGLYFLKAITPSGFSIMRCHLKK